MRGGTDCLVPLLLCCGAIRCGAETVFGWRGVAGEAGREGDGKRFRAGWMAVGKSAVLLKRDGSSGVGVVAVSPFRERPCTGLMSQSVCRDEIRSLRRLARLVLVGFAPNSTLSGLSVRLSGGPLRPLFKIRRISGPEQSDR